MNSTTRRLLVLLAALALTGALHACAYDLEELNLPLAPVAEAELKIVTDSPPAHAYDTMTTLENTEVPQRDQMALAQRLRKVEGIPLIVRDGPYQYQIGDEELFRVSNTDTDEDFQITAVLRHVTPHLYIWVEEGVEVDLDALGRSAERFEDQTYPTNRRVFGSEWSPGVDSDVHLNILHTRGLGSSVGGYYYSADEYSRLAHESSNEREMFYVNLDTVIPGSDYYDGLLAHEFQHMIHWHNDRNEDTWLNEGMAKLASFLNGFDAGLDVNSFLSQPDLQLDDFEYETSGSAHYNSAFLFALYFWERFGEEATRALISHPANGAVGITSVLEGRAEGLDFESLFADWAVALLLDDPDLRDGRYGLRSIDLPRPVPAADLFSAPVARTEAQVHQFASDYIRLTGTSPVTVVFTGTQQVPLIETVAHGGEAFWWSNRGDDADTTLTRAFDFSDLVTVTLDYWLWYDIEESWDYAYLEVSTDGGRTWDTIQTPHTTDENPTGNNFGHGYTGMSGDAGEPIWIHEQVDLSQYAGRPVLIRFEYITDDTVHNTGLVVDDFSIPQLDYWEGFEMEDPSWTAAGFVRHNNVLPQRFMIQLVELSAKPRVRRLLLDEWGRGRWEIPLSSDMNEAVLIVSGVTPVTRELSPYAYSVIAD